MQKTKLGVSVNLLGAIICLAPLSGGYVFLLGLVLYTLLMEENEWLKKTALQTLIVTFVFAVLSIVLDIIPDVIYAIDSVLNIFTLDFSIPFVSRIFSAAGTLVSLARTVVFLLMSLMSLSQGSLHIKKLNDFITKHTS